MLGIVGDAHDTREAAEAPCSKWRGPLHDLIVLCGPCLLPHDCIDLNALSVTTSGHQWLMVGSASAVGGQTATLDHGYVHTPASR